MNIIDFNTSNSAARIYAGTQKKHDTVNHRRVMMIDWTTRLESHAICKHADRNCEEVYGNLKLHFDAACCTFASLQRLLSASFALPRRLRRDAILRPRRSRRSARTRWEETHRTHVWCLLRQRRNDAARGARRKIAILAATCLRISVPLSRRTEGVRRLRFKT